MFKTILLATDGSDLSTKAVQAAIKFAKSNGSKIVGLSVAEIYSYFPVTMLGGTEDLRLLKEAVEQSAKENVQQIADSAREAGIVCEVYTPAGWCAQEIVKSAEQHHCDVIFMASHGRKGVNKLMLGSETQKVLAYSGIPVIVYKAAAGD
ncbi:universal stress protein [Glaciimonas sp. PCH181]|uniref:universal stress protein n=1 Tax=Glaciimonas sp. PCH181 TaxID=2133943 RepID=UPI000D3675DA|nr:universal stress protein [Glaciimonas sp. PCH181]PUA19454.1 universal stress protein [Glaciimonas sp. PCH181]